MNTEEQEAPTHNQGPIRSWTTTYQDYDERYPQVFAEVVKTIQKVLTLAHIEHVGSTSIPGLGGRKVLDIVVAAEPTRHDEMESKLVQMGCVKSPFTHFLPMLTWSLRYHDQDYPVLLYLLPEEHEIYRGWIAFRTYMQQHPEEVQRYAEVKKRAIAEGKTDPARYQQAKAPYLEDLVKHIGNQYQSL
jgi:GrpB-like predicted nucleotidyltransferase (UPF0157 family)